MTVPLQDTIELRETVICPHCWERFAPEDTRWVSQHMSLQGDARLGKDAPKRFLPSRFNVEGNAIDARGVVCQTLACPRCHLAVPRALFEMPPLFLSIVGTPSCGKTYFLASMTWKLRQTLPRNFAMSFADADPTSNRVLNAYEEDLFLSKSPHQPCKLLKTAEEGDLYDTVSYDENPVTYPKPFLFALRPLAHHPRFHRQSETSRIISVYDNAGESFQPGKDSWGRPVTQHLSQSKALMFIFDPTQDPRFRKACKGRTEDLQIREELTTSRQETVIHEVADRIRKYTGLSQNQKHARPLLVLVSKYDAWWQLLGEERLSSPWRSGNTDQFAALDLKKIDAVSLKLRQLLYEHCPEMVASVEGFASRVCYIPVSATGCGPEQDPVTKVIGIRPDSIEPTWVEVPLLYLLCKHEKGMIRYPRDYRP